MSQKKVPEPADELELDYDFSQGVRGKHHRAYQAGTNVVFLDRDVARSFKDSAAVNEALRLLVRLAKTRVVARSSTGGRESSARAAKSAARR